MFVVCLFYTCILTNFQIFAAPRSGFYVGLTKVDGKWKWPQNEREMGATGTGSWGPQEPNNEGDISIMYQSSIGRYEIGDLPGSSSQHVLCHVWYL